VKQAGQDGDGLEIRPTLGGRCRLFLRRIFCYKPSLSRLVAHRETGQLPRNMERTRNMEDVRKPQADQGAGLHLHLHAREASPEAFVPLRLVLHPGGATIDVDRPDVLVGRHTECDVRLPLPDVSRRHCRLQFVEGCWQVMDLNSLNGIQVNGEAVLQAPIQKGDRLKIGSFTFSVELLGEHKPVASGHGGSILETLAGFMKRKAS
jgi:hypothetical protein